MTRTTTLAAALAIALATLAGDAIAQQAAPTPATATTQPPDDSVLGTVDVTGSAAASLPKLGVVPVITQTDADTTLQLVVKGDLDRSGQFDVLTDDQAPSGLYLHDSAVDLAPWRAKGVDTVVKVVATKLPSGKYELVANAWLAASPKKEPAFTKRWEVEANKVRENAHRVSDALLAALTGRPGGFASHMVYSARVGRNAQVFAIDADGFDLHAASPAGQTALAPSFGPDDEIWYALSRDFGPFRLVRGAEATAVPLPVAGSVMGLAFTPDRKKLAVAVADEGTAKIYVGGADGSDVAPISTAPLANHPVFGPGGKIAYVAGGTAGQRVYVDGKAISPAGFNASAPAFCDTPNGLMVVFAVGVGNGADIVATDVRGGGITRITQNQGANSYPACSPDGRLIAFFSTRKHDKGPGLYVVPLTAPWRSRRISSELGESLRWDALPGGL